jgi:hypothetical protein
LRNIPDNFIPALKVAGGGDGDRGEAHEGNREKTHGCFRFKFSGEEKSVGNNSRAQNCEAAL